MKTVTLLSAIVLGAILWTSEAAFADPPQNSGATAAKAPAPPPGCVQGTGTLIPQKSAPCAAFGHSYTEEDLRKTGATSPGDALRILDPSLTVHR